MQRGAPLEAERATLMRLQLDRLRNLETLIQCGSHDFSRDSDVGFELR